MLMEHGKLMAETLGPVLFHSTHEAREAKYAHIRACIMREDTVNLPNAVLIDLPNPFRGARPGGSPRPPSPSEHSTQPTKDKQSGAPNPGPSTQATPLNTPARLKHVWKPRGPALPSNDPGSKRGLFKLDQHEDSNYETLQTNSANRFALLASLEPEEADPATEVPTQQLPPSISPSKTQPKPLNLNSSPQSINSGETAETARLLSQPPTQILDVLDDTQEQNELEDIGETQHLDQMIPHHDNIDDIQTGEEHDILSPFEQMIIAKRRALHNRDSSSHEEPLQDKGRDLLHKQNLRRNEGCPPTQILQGEATSPMIPQQQRNVVLHMSHWSPIQDAWRDSLNGGSLPLPTETEL
ncbi:hypothetical protein R1sor_027027 [Riccia sorocarpa]|uniref:Uncharacterized protein n=1 Tax=Riccia sorocarpa TaxID=122646 RepID=A0ABD3GH94_9MARC